MKKIKVSHLVGLSAGVLFFSAITACKEVGPEINLTETDYVTYIETPEAPQDKIVLIEDFTGAACPNCPDGHIAITDALTVNPGKAIAIAEYNYFADPLYIEQNFLTDEALNMNGYLGPVTGWPAIFIDRKDFGGDDYLAELPENVGTFTADQTAASTPVNLYIENIYDAASRLLTVRVKIKYTSAVTTVNHLSISLTESAIIAAQIDDNVGGEVEDYIHNHVLRKMLTYYTGDALPEENIAGRVYEFEYTYTIPESWNADNMNVVAFVHNYETDNKEVLQAVEGEVVE